MKKQLYVGKTLPEPNLITPAKNMGFIKGSGGLWTSSYENGTSEWVEWCKRENYNDSLMNGYLLTPKSDSKILTVDSLQDLQALLSEYSKPIPGITFMVALDFEAMSNDYDAMRLTSKGERETRWSEPSLYGWDVESTHWFRWSFDKVEAIGQFFTKETISS